MKKVFDTNWVYNSISLLGILFIVLKLFHVIHWSWVVVFLPFIILLVSTIGMLLIILAIAKYLDKNNFWPKDAENEK